MLLKLCNFGTDEIYPPIGKTNLERLHEELDDMLSIISMLNEEFNFKYDVNVDAQIKENKKNKVNHFSQYSIDLGMIK